MKEKILFIAPHLSTGGLPQYLFKQMESLVDDFDVYCIEWENVTGGVLVIQRNRVVNLLGDRLITLPEDKHQLFTVIEQLQPDIIHIQEIPELFMSHDVAQKLYDEYNAFHTPKHCFEVYYQHLINHAPVDKRVCCPLKTYDIYKRFWDDEETFWKDKR